MVEPHQLRRQRISGRFSHLASEDRPAFIPFVTVGYPSIAATEELVLALAESGADVIELGIPFSDPVADGPTIQAASQHALEGGTTVDDVFEVLAHLRRHSDVPVVLFAYSNVVFARGVEEFVLTAFGAGADGLLTTDLPLGCDPEIEAQLEAGPLDLIRLIAPTTPSVRACAIASRSQGFVYYISKTGVTGASDHLSGGLIGEVGALRGMSKTPVAVGFGVSTPDHARAVGRAADGVVVGSALVDALGAGGVEAAARFATALRKALDESRG